MVRPFGGTPENENPHFERTLNSNLIRSIWGMELRSLAHRFIMSHPILAFEPASCTGQDNRKCLRLRGLGAERELAIHDSMSLSCQPTARAPKLSGLAKTDIPSANCPVTN